jgi:hypothetical protein
MLAAGSQDASPERRHGLDLTGVGAALFLLSAVILRLDATWWDERL